MKTMGRRQFLKISALGSLATAMPQAVWAGPVSLTARDRMSRPNVLVILADDLGYGDVQCLNPQRGKIPTPHFDRLASQGMTFTDAHAGSSVCSPSRYGLLTGRYAWRTSLQSSILRNDSPALIAADRFSLPVLLKQQGYQTVGMGKWHLGRDLPLDGDHILVERPIKNGPTTRGFDSYFSSDMRFFAPFMFIENDRFVGPPLYPQTKQGARYGKGTPLTLDAFSHILPTVCDRAIAQIQASTGAGKPFFMYLAPCAPHDPYVPTKEWKGRSGLGDYGDYVMETDAEIGRVLKALDESGQADNTLVIFASDNGCAHYADPGVKTMEALGHYPSAQFRGYKSDIWDGGHRIPFIVRWPGTVKPGTASARLVCLTDLLVTVADTLGVKLPDNAGEDSVSILPLLHGADQPVRQHVVSHSIDGKFAIRDGPWKLVLCPGSGGWNTKDAEAAQQGLPIVQLYDLESDPGEKTNVVARHPDRVKSMIAALKKVVADGRSTPGAQQQNDVPVDIWKLNTLPGVSASVAQEYEERGTANAQRAR